MTRKRKKKLDHRGSTLDSLLQEDGILEKLERVAHRAVAAGCRAESHSSFRFQRMQKIAKVVANLERSCELQIRTSWIGHEHTVQGFVTDQSARAWGRIVGVGGVFGRLLVRARDDCTA